MDWWGGLGQTAESIGAYQGLLVLGGLLFLKAAGVPLPIPGIPLVFLVGAYVGEGLIPFGLALGVLSFATASGACVLYLAVRRVGRQPVEQYGRHVGLTHERLERAGGHIQRGGWWAIMMGRVVPGLRLATVIAAGLFAVRALRFATAAAVGALIETSLCLLAGMVFGSAVIDLVARIALPWGFIVSATLLGVLIHWLVKAHRAARPRGTSVSAMRTGALAGGLATLGTCLVLNVLASVSAALHAWTTWGAERQLQHTAIVVLGVSLLLVAEGTVLGVVYATWAEPRLARLTDWQRGIAFALPTVLLPSVIVVAVGADLDPEQTAFVLGLELVRAVTYGAFLGYSSSVFQSPLATSPADSPESFSAAPASTG